MMCDTITLRAALPCVIGLTLRLYAVEMEQCLSEVAFMQGRQNDTMSQTKNF